jgi:uracil-DNA glycosylase family 4
MDKSEIIHELKKAMAFYQELGFSSLPVRHERAITLFNGSRTESQDDEMVRPGEAGDTVQKKSQALLRLREEIGDCTRCRLCRNRKNIVFGEGFPEAELMFVGEGPGRDEDIQARPFVGSAGKLLTSLIEKMGMKREGVYIANIVKCRPPNNRDPEEDEIATCRPFVEKQIEIISPKVIITLGRVSTQALLNTKIPISRLRGTFCEFRGIPVMPTFHPAYLLRNPKDKWLTWDDVQKVLAKLKDRSQSSGTGGQD